MRPAVGQMVHYQAYGSAVEDPFSPPRAAIITDVLPDLPGEKPDSVGLVVFSTHGVSFMRCVPFSLTPKAGAWSWPPSNRRQADPPHVPLEQDDDPTACGICGKVHPSWWAPCPP